jgi:hypothetical protein
VVALAVRQRPAVKAAGEGDHRQAAAEGLLRVYGATFCPLATFGGAAGGNPTPDLFW